MDKIKPVFTITATSTGGRNGHSQTSDSAVSVALSVPKDMGGPGKPNTVTPEHLFAAGYAACFEARLTLLPNNIEKMPLRLKSIAVFQ